LSGQRALVTGASSGLGAAVAHELVAQGARVLINSRSSERLQARADAIAAACPDGTPPAICAADVAQAEAAPALAARARKLLGGLDVLVCNAGGPSPGNFANIDDDGWRAGFELVFLSAVRSLRACLPLLRERGAGRVAIITSVSGLQPIPRLMLSNTLRPALMGLVRHLASELAADRILINAVAPGFFDTQRSREVQEAMGVQRGVPLATVEAELAQHIPLGRQGEPAELARLIAFLVSPGNGYLTGQTLVIDGGLVVAAR
jgi:3-oxoacyl-[acyl-carrier protein] reductase